MQLTVLGNRSPYPVQAGSCSGYLLQSGKQNILLDVGPGTLSALDQVINYHELQAVVISHLHEDHWLDLYPLHYAIKRSLKWGAREEALPIYMPFSGGVEFDYIKNKFGSEYYLKPIEEGKEITLGEIKFTFSLTQHSKECYAFRVEKGDQTLGYTADTAWDESLIEFLAGVNILLTESTLLKKDKEETISHLTVGEGVELGELLEAEKILLTHLDSEYNIEEIKKEIPSSTSQVEVAEVLKSYRIRR